MVLSCTGGYNGASLSAGGQYFSPARSSVTNLVVRISCYLFENKKMRKSQHIRTYAFLLHDLPMKFSPILPFLTRFRKKRRVAASPTGFTQKRHTLYVYYSRFGWRFQIFFEWFPSRSIILWAITMLPDNIKIGTCLKSRCRFLISYHAACIFGVSGVKAA